MAINTPVYSIIYDKSLASDPEACLTYAGSCEGFTPMSNTGDMNCDEGSWAEGNGTIFDAIKVGYIDVSSGFHESSKSSMNGDGASYWCTRIPRIYQKVTDISDAGDNSKVKLDLSPVPFSGASLHPSFMRSGTELNNVYIGRYLSYLNTYINTLCSYSGHTIATSKTRANFRAYAENCGESYSLLKYYDWDLVNKLYLLAFKNFDSQTALGPGLTDGSITTTGGTDGGSWMCSKSMTGSASMCFLGIEDWWGHYYQIVDDYYIASGNKHYAGTNTAVTDNTSNKTLIAQGTPSGNSYLSPKYGLTCQGTADGFFIVETQDSSSSTGLCDNFYYDSNANYVIGGDWYSEALAGAFCWDSVDPSNAYNNISARLTYVD